MDTFQKLRGTAPDELLDFLNQVLGFFPSEFQFRLQQVIDTLPEEGDNMHKILDLVRGQWKGLQSEEWARIAIVGPSKTGKASLLRAIEAGQTTSSPPVFSMVDTTGLNEFLGYDTLQQPPSAIRESDAIVLLLDGRYDVSSVTQSMVDRLRSLNKPLLVALSKADLVAKPVEAARRAEKQLRQRVVPVSAYQQQSIDRLLRAVVARHHGALYPLTRSFPAFRSSICAGIVNQASIACGLVGAIPIPVSDLLPITAIQTGMLLKIARAFGHPLDRQRARELIPMLASGIAMRELSHRLRRQFPAQGKLIGATAAGGWTLLLGRAAIAYFESFVELLETEGTGQLYAAREV